MAEEGGRVGARREARGQGGEEAAGAGGHEGGEQLDPFALVSQNNARGLKAWVLDQRTSKDQVHKLRDQQGLSLLDHAARCGHHESAMVLVEEAAFPLNPARRVTPLCWAACGGNRALVGSLLARGARLDACDPHHDNPLTWACLMASHGCVEELLSRGCSVEGVNVDGTNPAMCALSAGSVACAQAVCAHAREALDEASQARLLLHRNKNGFTALHFAVGSKVLDAACLRLVVDWAGDLGAHGVLQQLVCAKTKQGHTANSLLRSRAAGVQQCKARLAAKKSESGSGDATALERSLEEETAKLVMCSEILDQAMARAEAASAQAASELLQAGDQPSKPAKSPGGSRQHEEKEATPSANTRKGGAKKKRKAKAKAKAKAGALVLQQEGEGLDGDALANDHNATNGQEQDSKCAEEGGEEGGDDLEAPDPHPSAVPSRFVAAVGARPSHLGAEAAAAATVFQLPELVAAPRGPQPPDNAQEEPVAPAGVVEELQAVLHQSSPVCGVLSVGVASALGADLDSLSMSQIEALEAFHRDQLAALSAAKGALFQKQFL